MSDIVLTPIKGGDDADADILMTNFNAIVGGMADIESYVNTIATGSESLTREVNSLRTYRVAVGTVIWFAANDAPPGYLICNGTKYATTGSNGFPELYAVIGQTFGWDAENNKFAVPNLMGNYPRIQGSATVGTNIEAGLPNIWGKFCGIEGGGHTAGAFYKGAKSDDPANGSGDGDNYVEFSAANYNTIYGASDTVQPRALTLLPCIKY